MNRMIQTLALVAAIFFVSASSQAVVINFDSHGTDLSDPVVVDGFQFDYTATYGGIVENNVAFSPQPVTNGTTRMVLGGAVSGNDAQVVMTTQSGLRFDLDGVSAATLFLQFPANQLVVEGYRSNSLVATRTVSVLNFFTNISFDSTWENLDSVIFIDGNGGSFTRSAGLSLDNIDATAVPEPATLAILGLGALAAMRQRRNR